MNDSVMRIENLELINKFFSFMLFLMAMQVKSKYQSILKMNFIPNMILNLDLFTPFFQI